MSTATPRPMPPGKRVGLIVVPPDPGRKWAHLVVLTRKPGQRWVTAQCMGQARRCRAGECAHAQGVAAGVAWCRPVPRPEDRSAA